MGLSGWPHSRLTVLAPVLLGSETAPEAHGGAAQGAGRAAIRRYFTPDQAQPQDQTLSTTILPSTINSDPAERMRLVGISGALLHVDSIDDQDRDLILEHTQAYWSEAEPRPAVGDIVRLDWAGIRTVRIAYLWPDGQFQPSRGAGSFHLLPESMSYSGALTEPRPTGHLIALPRPEWARCWIFHHGLAGAGRGLDVEIPRRVWVYDRSYFA